MAGLTTVLGLVLDERDRMYVLESMTAPAFPGPGEFEKGKVVRIEPNDPRWHLISSRAKTSPFPAPMGFPFRSWIAAGPSRRHSVFPDFLALRAFRFPQPGAQTMNSW
jgi:hypothetical protein